MAYRIELTPAAEKTLTMVAKSNRTLLKRLDHALLSLAKNPIPAGCKQLVGEDLSLYRVSLRHRHYGAYFLERFGRCLFY